MFKYNTYEIDKNSDVIVILPSCLDFDLMFLKKAQECVDDQSAARNLFRIQNQTIK